VKSWSPTSIAVTIPAGAATGDLTVTPQNDAPSTVPNGITVMHLAALKPGNGVPGATIGITGNGFGSEKGSVSIAGVNAPVTIWGDSTIAVVVPSIPRYAGSGGDDHIVVNVPGAASAMSAAFHVDPVPPATPNSTPGQNTPGNTPGGVPTIDPITGMPTNGASASPTNGNAPSFSPAKGVTDAQGKVSGVLHLSKRAGDHIILARSGQYSDEIKITGRGLANTGGAGGGTDSSVGGGGGSPQRTIIVAALLACL